MKRLTLTLVAWLGVVSVVSASLTPRKESPRWVNYVPRAQPARIAKGSTPVPEPGAPGGQAEFVMTERTEVFLNGKPCKYRDVPGHASILRMELAADKKTVLKVHFRTRK